MTYVVRNLKHFTADTPTKNMRAFKSFVFVYIGVIQQCLMILSLNFLKIYFTV